MTYPGAFHHAMNRGYKGKPIFEPEGMKEFFLAMLEEHAMKFRIRIFSYSITSNHYHLVLENSS